MKWRECLCLRWRKKEGLKWMEMAKRYPVPPFQNGMSLHEAPWSSHTKAWKVLRRIWLKHRRYFHMSLRRRPFPQGISSCSRNLLQPLLQMSDNQVSHISFPYPDSGQGEEVERILIFPYPRFPLRGKSLEWCAYLCSVHLCLKGRAEEYAQPSSIGPKVSFRPNPRSQPWPWWHLEALGDSLPTLRRIGMTVSPPPLPSGSLCRLFYRGK